ncbi:uncharacterized protein LOC112566653 isoform X2 [Pomacea canaliculata]|uniref:uncharacterized protein LOC112566653 isoform X2 n=1 Tax=Pomacea canaliculata TaxID=400727 RepID=UPI000D73B264|nr:uncharacterized protein LOC112566653 isoform X2 [Pomacea canaliculata]
MGPKAVLVFAAVCSGLAMVRSQAIMDCENYNPNICFSDVVPFCLQNGTIVISICEAKRAVCRENAQLDETFAACRPQQPNFDCDNFNPMVCSKDTIPFCLTDGTAITGRCEAQKAVCKEGKTIDPSFKACDKISPRSEDLDNDSSKLAAKATERKIGDKEL